jgi:Leucine-rich repeat (LRR) protein
LEVLNLSKTGVEDISPLSINRKIKSLDISDINVYSINALAHLDELVSVNLENTAVSDISPLSALEKLKYLNVCGTNITDTSVVRPTVKIEGPKRSSDA